MFAELVRHACVDKYQTSAPVHILWLLSVGDRSDFVCVVRLYFKEMYQSLFEDQHYTSAFPETGTVYIYVPEKRPLFQFPCSVTLAHQVDYFYRKLFFS